jgi:alkaline phosphatase
MAKNVILMVGDGMGWEAARAAAIAKQIQAGKTGDTLSDFYTEGKGEGLNFQTLESYTLATTYGTTVADTKGVYSTGNSALLNSSEAIQGPIPADLVDPITGVNPVRPGFEFDPAFNPGAKASGGATTKDANGNLVGYDPAKGGATPWEAGSDPEYIKHSYPDSANTATTLYTGVKSYNNAVAVDLFEQPLETILATANKVGKSTGLVTSVPVDHATPAAASANVNRRGKYDGDFPSLDNILQQQLREYQPTVLLGGGHPLSTVKDAALPEGVEPDFTYIAESTYNELSNNPNSNIYGYSFLERGTDAAATLAAEAAAIDPNAGQRLLGLYGARGQNGNLPVASANGDYSSTGLDQFSLFSSTSGNATDQTPAPDVKRPLAPDETDASFVTRERNENPTLSDLSLAALDVLEDDPDGFWMMIEGGDIDWGLHDDNIDNAVGNTLQFDKAVGDVISWINENGGFEENLLVVTADHDHYLTLNENFPQLLQSQGAEALTVGQNAPAEAGHFFGSDPNIKYGWGSHSNRLVPVYYQGEGSEVLTDLIGKGFESYADQIPGVANAVDQSNIYQAMYAAVTDGAAPLPTPAIPTAADTVVPKPASVVPKTNFASAGGAVVLVDTAGEIFFGSDGADFFDATGSLGGNRIMGQDGNDLILGKANDAIMGGKGDDILFAGKGGNTLTGDAGADQFWVAAGSLPDTGNIITDFTIGTDVIGFAGISGVASFKDVDLVQSGADTRILSPAGGLAIAVLNNITAANLGESSFAFG